MAASSLVACWRPASVESTQGSSGLLPSAAERPQLVVSVVVDQLGAWVLNRHKPLLSEHGIFRRAEKEGVYHARVEYPFGATITAAGHATLHTGVAPNRHGVVANTRYDIVSGSQRALVDDGIHAVLGAEGFASPAVLKVPTVADHLKAQTQGKAIVASISIKDRGAVLPGGKRPDLVLFYHSAIPGFTSSTYYTSSIPKWLEVWGAKHPVSAYIGPWNALPQTQKRAGVSDNREVESLIPELTRTFPHDLTDTDQAASLFRYTPGATQYQLDCAEEAVWALAMGQDDIPDLLAISISGSDYIGHLFGAESWEYIDNLIRTDMMLAAFIDKLAKRTRVAVVISSDHGQAPLPDSPSVSRIFPRQLMDDVNTVLVKKFGEGEYVGGYYIPYVYLSQSAVKDERREAILEAMLAELQQHPEIALAVATREAVGWTGASDPLKRAIAMGIDLERSGHIYVLPSKGVIVDPGTNGGTTHGTPYLYDREVPVLAWGVGISKASSEQTLDIRRYAASLAKLLGISIGDDVPASLPGFERPAGVKATRSDL